MSIQDSMKITNQIQNITSGKVKSSEQLMRGEIVDKISENEAEVKVGSNSYRVRSEKPLPETENFSFKLIEIQESSSGEKTLIIDPIKGFESSNTINNDTQNVSIETALQNQNIKSSPEILKVLSVLKNNGVKLSADNLNHISKFINEASGSIDKKIITLLMTHKKGLPLENVFSEKIHKALNNPPARNELVENTNTLKALISDVTKELESIVSESKILENKILTREVEESYKNLEPKFSNIKARLLSEESPNIKIIKEKLLEASIKELPKRNFESAKISINNIESKSDALNVVKSLSELRVSEVKQQLEQNATNLKISTDWIKSEIVAAKDSALHSKELSVFENSIRENFSKDITISQEFKDEIIKKSIDLLEPLKTLDSIGKPAVALSKLEQVADTLIDFAESKINVETEKSISLENHERLSKLVDTLKTSLESSKSLEEIKSKFDDILKNSNETLPVKKWLRSAFQDELKNLYNNLNKMSTIDDNVDVRSKIPLNATLNEIESTFNESKNVKKTINLIEEKLLTHKDIPEPIQKSLKNKIALSLNKAKNLSQFGLRRQAEIPLNNVLKQLKSELKPILEHQHKESSTATKIVDSSNSNLESKITKTNTNANNIENGTSKSNFKVLTKEVSNLDSISKVVDSETSSSDSRSKPVDSETSSSDYRFKPADSEASKSKIIANKDSSSDLISDKVSTKTSPLNSKLNDALTIRQIHQSAKLDPSFHSKIQTTIDSLSKLLQVNLQLNETIDVIKQGENDLISRKATEIIRNLENMLDASDQNFTSPEQKIEMINEAVNKARLDIGDLIHQQLPSLEKVLTNQLSNIRNHDSLESIDLSAISKAITSDQQSILDSISNALEKAQILSGKNMDSTAINTMIKALEENIKYVQNLQSIDNETFESFKSTLIDTIDNLKLDIENFSNLSANEDNLNNPIDLSKGFEQIKSDLNEPQGFKKAQNTLDSLPFPDEIKEKLSSILKSGSQSAKLGYSQRAVGKSLKEINDVENKFKSESESLKVDKSKAEEIDKKFDNPSNQVSDSDNILASPEIKEILNPLDIGTKDFIVTTITEKMKKVEKDFASMKRDLSTTINSIKQLAESTRQPIHRHTKETLEKAIAKFDKMLNKSELLLYTDMKTERKLIGFSSDLAKAQKFLQQGQNSEAAKILGSVQKELDKMVFKPSTSKAMHMVIAQREVLKRQNLKSLVERELIYDVTKNAISKPSSKNVFELIRSNGLNYDSDIASGLASDDPELIKQAEETLKGALLKWSEKDSSSVSQAIDQTTGQQLLSKADNNSNQQMMYFSLPIQLSEEQGKLKVFLNSRRNGDRIDWENTNLYFLIDTPRLGETGILVEIKNRNLKLTLKNNHLNSLENAKANAEKFKMHLQEIGYNIEDISFNNLKSEVVSDKSNTPEDDPYLIYNIDTKGASWSI
jgi:hypothetical protein